jgi:hypothetical protein
MCHNFLILLSITYINMPIATNPVVGSILMSLNINSWNYYDIVLNTHVIQQRIAVFA